MNDLVEKIKRFTMNSLTEQVRCIRKRLTASALIGILLCTSAISLADQQSVDQRIKMPADGVVRITVVRGEVEVQGWDRDEIEVRGFLDEDTEKFIFEVDGREAVVEVKIPRSNSGWLRKDETDIVVHVPVMSQVDVSGVSTDVEVDGTRAVIKVGVVSGDVSVTGGANRISLSTVSGEVDMRDSHGRIRVKTVSGDIESFKTSGTSDYGTVSGSILIESGSEELELETVSGDVEVARTRILAISGHSVSGDIDIRGEMNPGASIDYDNVSGSIRLKLGGEINAKFDLETGSGNIRNRLTDDKPKVSKYVRDERLRFTVGEGTSEVTLTTRSGDITVSD